MTPGAFALNIYRGDSYLWRFVLWADAERLDPVDLTGMTVKAEIRDKPAGLIIVVPALVVTLPNIVDMTLTAAQTGVMLAAGKWDLQITDAGWVSTILAGAVKVTGDITDSTGHPAAAASRQAGYLVEAE